MKRLAEGTIIADNYRIGTLIGEGAMGSVYRATQISLNRPVALKLLHPQYAVRTDSRARFEREARVAASLRHPNAVQILEFGNQDGWLFLAMELLEGYPLRAALVNAHALRELSWILGICRQVASVLVAAHRIQLVHRDIKPENIFLEPGETDVERVRVVDFGLAFIAGDDQAHEDMGPTGRLTQDGILGGTPSYMSPEQAQAAAIGPPSDIYALGIVMYEMLVGEPPFRGNVAQILTRHVFEAPVLPRRRMPERDIPARLDELIGAMLRKSPAHRPTAEQVEQACKELIGEPVSRTSVAMAGSRAERMVEIGGIPHSALVDSARTTLDVPVSAAGAAPAEPRIPLGMIGTLDPDFLLGLVSNGFAVRETSVEQLLATKPGDESTSVAAIYAPGLELADIRALAERGIPVVTDVALGDMSALVELIRAGAVDAVIRPVSGDDLARKLHRILRRTMRGRSSR